MLTTKLSASDYFRQAYDNRYTWDSQFPGYNADITFSRGDRAVSGQISIDRSLKHVVKGIEGSASN